MSYKVINDIENERISQISNHGIEQHQIADKGFEAWLRQKAIVLMEEVGEWCQEIQEGRLEEMYNEAIQVAAVAVANCEGINFYRENLNAVQSRDL